MKIIYLLSVFYLMISFLLYKKANKKLSIVSSVIYTIGVLFCYNTMVVCLYTFLKIKGSLLVLSLFNYGIGSLLNLISLKRKERQQYIFDKKEFMVVICILLIAFLIGFFRFRGFTTISYETGDPAIHYRQALHFKEKLEILGMENSKDIVYVNFYRALPISYVNSGLLLHIFSDMSSYQLFTIYDVLCYGLYAILFFVTIFQILGQKKKYLFYSFILTLLYMLAFPLNNLVFGFCYLGLGIMVVNLLYLTVRQIKDFDKQVLFQLCLLFILTFSVFFSYYLFMPCVYLALGLYYIYLWKKKKLSLKKLLLYGIVTLIIPFLIGFIHFILPDYTVFREGTIAAAAKSEGYIYSNITPIYLLIMVTGIILYKKALGKGKVSYFQLNLDVITSCIFLFIILYLLKKMELYYLYKLFYLYWFFVIIYLGKSLIKWKKYVYIIFSLILMGMGIVYLFPNSKMTSFLTSINIYNWNARTFLDDKIIFTEKELEIMDKSIQYQDVCEENNEFLILGNKFKNLWFYSYTGSVPVFGYRYENPNQLYETNIGFKFWTGLKKYDCLVYFYEDNKVDYEKDNFDILYQNEDGAILKKKVK